MKSKLEIYALSVCFAAVFCIVISAGIAGYAVFSVATPELTLNENTYASHQTNDAYWRSQPSYSNEGKQEDRPSEAELTQQRQESLVIAINGERRSGFQTLLQCFMFLLVAGLTLLIHWRVARGARSVSP